MIKLCDKEILDFINWINNNQTNIDDVKLVILHGFDKVMDEEGNYGFGVYNTKEKIIMVGGDMPKLDNYRYVFETIAHEYKHHIQNCEVKDFNEEEAEIYASTIVNNYIDNLII